MDAKAKGNLLVLAGGPTAGAMGGSHYEMLFGTPAPSVDLPAVDPAVGARAARAVAGLIAQRLVRSAHDCSDGGLLVAAAEMAMAGGLGLELALDGPACFSEEPARYLLEIAPDDLDAVSATLSDLTHFVVGEFTGDRRLTLSEAHLDVPIDELLSAWMGTLDW